VIGGRVSNGSGQPAARPDPLLRRTSARPLLAAALISGGVSRLIRVYVNQAFPLCSLP